jgi:hypothetical protein
MLAVSKAINEVENIIDDLPQVDCPVAHYFGDGIYIREVTMPAGTLAIGHVQKFPQNNIMLAGKILMFVDGGTKILEAPQFFVGEAGRKMGLVLETVVWQNVWATDETDVEKLEEMYLDKSASSVLLESERNQIEYAMREIDRADYEEVIEASPFTHEQVKEQVENEADQISMPSDWASVVTRRSSNIAGDGMFLSWPVEKGGVLGPARLDGKRTPLGRYTNHSMTPNAHPVVMDNGDVYLEAKQYISGCKGGSHGEEITVDYRDMLRVQGIEL